MTGFGALPPDRVPTLTEVVSWPEPGAPEPMAPWAPAPSTGPDAPAWHATPVASVEPPAAAPPAPTPVSEEQVINRVMADLQRQIDLMLDYRLREVLTPLLNRAADGLVREARGELASTLRDVVARAVAQELARHRTR